MVVEQIAILTWLGEAEPSKRFNMNKFDMRMMDLLHWNEVEIALIMLEKKMLFDNRLSINNLIMHCNL